LGKVAVQAMGRLARHPNIKREAVRVAEVAGRLAAGRDERCGHDDDL
jgi:hypothetical protein